MYRPVSAYTVILRAYMLTHWLEHTIRREETVSL